VVESPPPPPPDSTNADQTHNLIADATNAQSQAPDKLPVRTQDIIAANPGPSTGTAGIGTGNGPGNGTGTGNGNGIGNGPGPGNGEDTGINPDSSTNSTTPPAHIKVFHGPYAVKNGQPASLNFGSVPQNLPGRIDTFTITNAGEQTLNVGPITLPSGFTLTKSPPATIGAGSNGTFSVQLDSGAMGTNSGDITIKNNDPTNGTFSFPVIGTVTPPIPPPQLQLFNGTNAITDGQRTR